MGKFHRINQYIKTETVRVINEKGEQLGVMPLNQALNQARELGVDLVEVASTANPPVAKLIQFTKFKYQESKKVRAGLNKGVQETKEILLRPFMADNDLNIKLNRVKELLKDGDKVKLVVKFKGREITRKEFGEAVMAKALNSLAGHAVIEQQPKMIGKLIIAQIKPRR